MSITTKICQLCGKLENLSMCSGCKNAWYCSHEHQRTDWKVHKLLCGKTDSKKPVQQIDPPSDITEVASAANNNKPPSSNSSSSVDKQIEVDSSDINPKSEPCVSSKNKRKKKKKSKNNSSVNVTMATSTETKSTQTPLNEDYCSPPPGAEKYPNNESDEKASSSSNTSEKKSRSRHPSKNDNEHSSDFVHGDNIIRMPEFESEESLSKRLLEVHHYVVKCMSKYGICVIDNFLGEEQGTRILNEVKQCYNSGGFTQGQLVSPTSHNDSTNELIRSDMIKWMNNNEERYKNITFLLKCIDRLVVLCKGKLGPYQINGRTKGMVACYPGNDSKYLRHIDNPNSDGRCMTSIYYVNKNWDIKTDGGLLRIFPKGQDNVANIIPQFDRLLFFWSDDRNPHEVQAAKRCRYAVTVWYYDAEERKAYMRRRLNHKKENLNNEESKVAKKE